MQDRRRYYSSTQFVVCARLAPKTLCPTIFHCLQTVVGSDLAQHPTEVVLDGLFGQVQSSGNLFVGETLTDELDQLLLPPSEPQILSYLDSWFP